MSAEVWKDIPGFEGLYEVSDTGGVRSRSRPITRTYKSGHVARTEHKGRILRQGTNKRGYRFVVLRRDGWSVTREVHRLVAAAFLPKPTPGQTQVRHLDGDRLNNARANLAWGTASENQLDLYSYRGYHHRLTPDDVHEIRLRLSQGVTGRELAKQFGVSESNISEIKQGGSFAWLN